jgi:hypothetical protein
VRIFNTATGANGYSAGDDSLLQIEKQTAHDAERNFNPAVVVFRGRSAPFVFRFFYAFHEAKQGNPQFVATLEKQMFRALQIDTDSDSD